MAASSLLLPIEDAAQRQRRNPSSSLGFMRQAAAPLSSLQEPPQKNIAAPYRGT